MVDLLPTTWFPKESRTLCYLHEGLGLAVADEAASPLAKQLLTFTIPSVADTASLARRSCRWARECPEESHVTWYYLPWYLGTLALSHLPSRFQICCPS